MLNFALMGCGRIAHKHAEVLSTHVEGARLVAVCDVNVERAKSLGSSYSVPSFENIHDLLKSVDVDVVNILTPSGLHAQHALEVIPYKKHVIVEKPMALKLEDADAMIASAERHGVRLFVVKQNRFNLPVKKLREAVDAGRFGRLVMGTVRVRWCRRQEYYDQDSWRGTWLMDGGVFTNQASHHIDLLEWICGEVDSVYAKATTRLVDIEAEDTGVALLRFKSGALGVIEATTATRPVDLEGSISILGEKGTVEIGGFAVNQMKVWKFEDMRPEDDLVLKKYAQNPPTVYGFGHQEYLQTAVNSIFEDKEPLVSGAEGRKSLELISAIYSSIESGREVFLSQPAIRLGRPLISEMRGLV